MSATTRSNRASVRRAFVEMRGSRQWVVVLFLLDMTSAPLILLTPVPIALAVDSALDGRPIPGWLAALVPEWFESSSRAVLLLACVLQVLVVLLVQGRELLATYVFSRVGERVTVDVRSRMLMHAQQLSFGFHDSRGTADSIYRIQYDAPAIQQLAFFGVLPFVTAGFTLLAMVVVMISIDLQLALVAIAIAPVLFVLARAFRLRMKPRYQQLAEVESRALGVVHEVLAAFRVVKSFGREQPETRRFAERSRLSADTRVAVSLGEGVFTLLISLTTAVGTAVILYVGISRVQSGGLTLGALLLVLAYLTQLFGPLETLSQQAAKLQALAVSTERVVELLDEQPDVTDRPNAVPLYRAWGDFELLDVSFGYPDGPDVLRSVNLRVPAGSRVGLVGRTGAGKSTLISLLIRFYDVRTGVIRLDGRDIRDYRLDDLRSQFAMVLQEPFLFATTIADNIAYARKATCKEVVDAAVAAGVHDFIAGLPDGYETVVGERGMRLSGGERQRISLARAFLKDAPILLLDEPTSSVDVATEGEIMDAMVRLMEGRTTFMIAHRLSTLSVCDMVLEVANGEIRVVRDDLAGCRERLSSGV